MRALLDDERRKAGGASETGGHDEARARQKRRERLDQPRDKRENGEPAPIDPRRVISFRASQVMKARVDQAHNGHSGGAAQD